MANASEIALHSEAGPVSGHPSHMVHEPHIEWCFDILVYCQWQPNCSTSVLPKLQRYSIYSFLVNGVLTTFSFTFGLTGNILLLNQIRHSRLFSRRLACHLRLLCLWDMMLLVSCFVTSGAPSLLYKITPTYGFFAYIVYLFQPFASFCVTCTIWQVSVITTERYLAVSHPFIHQRMKDRLKLKMICFTTVFCSFLLNIITIPIERSLTDCYRMEVRNNQSVNTKSTQLVQNEIMTNLYYALFVYLIPDLLFRAPVPTILIGVLTIRTLWIYKKRRVGSLTINIQRSKSIPFMLTVLNLKFILCNTLYMFNTILVEVMGYGRFQIGSPDSDFSPQRETTKVEHYVGTLYLGDFSNMLLGLHSATNWLVFYHWTTKRTLTSFNSNLATRIGNSHIDPQNAQQLLSRFTTQKHRIGTEVITRLCQESSLLTGMLTGDISMKRENLRENEYIQAHGKAMGDFIEGILTTLAGGTASLEEIRGMCREIGRLHHMAGVRFTPVQWKLARDVLIWCVSAPPSKWLSAKCYDDLLLESSAKKTFNLVFAELKNGALCAAADDKHTPTRVGSTCRRPLYSSSPE